MIPEYQLSGSLLSWHPNFELISNSTRYNTTKNFSWKYPGNQDLRMAKLSEVHPSSVEVYIERMDNAYDSAISSTCHRHDVS